MKQFLIRISSFTVFISLVFFILVSAYVFQARNELLKKPRINYLILGDSHLQGGINNNLFPSTALNWAASAENYFYCKNKLQFLIAHKIQIDNVILSYGPHNLNIDIDSTWINDKNNFLEKSKMNFPFIDFTELRQYIKTTQKSPLIQLELFAEILYQSVYYLERKVLLGKLPYSGGFEPLSKTLDNSKKSNLEKPADVKEFSRVQLKYFNEIIKLCNEKNIKIYLLNAPLFDGTKVFTPPTENKEFTILDYGDLFKGKNDLFADFVHLNAKGANLFTDKLITDLNQK